MESLKRPLKFGDVEQIKFVKKAEAKQTFKELPNCKECKGTGRGCDCEYCASECPACDAIGKDWKAFKEFRAKYPECNYPLKELKANV